MLNEPRPQRTYDELSEALSRLIRAAHGDVEAKANCFSVPINLMADADMILSDGIAELMLLRGQVTRQTTLLARRDLLVARLKRLVIHYRLLLRMGHGPE